MIYRYTVYNYNLKRCNVQSTQSTCEYKFHVHTTYT